MWLATLWRTAFALGNRIRRPRRSTLTTPARREHTQRPTSVGMRLLLGLAGVAIIAITTSCEPPTDHGVSYVGKKDDRLIAVARAIGHSTVTTFYESADSGWTWILVGGQDEAKIEWGEESAHTPQGTYRLDGSDIVLVDGLERSETVWSAAHLAEPANLWVQSQVTRHLDYRRLSTGPGHGAERLRAMVLDPHSGNVVVAMGIQGVLVGTEAGQWTSVAVGPYAPTDFSSLQKVKTLLSASDFLTAALSLPVSMTALALVVAQVGQRKRVRLSDYLALFLVLGPVVLVTLLAGLLVISIDASPIGSSTRPTELLDAGKVLVTCIAFMVAIAAAIAVWEGQWNPLRWAVAGSILGMMAFLALPFLAWVMAGWPSVFAELASILSCTAVAIALAFSLWRRKVHDLAPS